MPTLSGFRPLSNHELIAQIKNRSIGHSDQAILLELGLLKVELMKRSNPVKSPFSRPSVRPGTTDLEGSDLKAYDADPSLRLNTSDAIVLANHMHSLSFSDQLDVRGTLSIALGIRETRDIIHANRTKNWKSAVKIVAQNVFFAAIIFAAIYFYQAYKRGH
ncbi:MAG: hypothetical protein EOP04_00040 [Proteobacteria bacterium]|nr:MAG: hypothetical protein EOP04_00040 [Pseudomonadota bacterium]